MIAFVGYRAYSTQGNLDKVNVAYAEIKKIATKTRDTIIKIDTLKLKADTKYKKIHDTLYLVSDAEVDSIFDVTFERDSLDTSNYSAGVSQYRKAIDAQLKFIRDSTKLAATTKQVTVCTTAVSDIGKKVDTIVKIKTETSYVSTFISFIVGGFLAWAIFH